MSDVSSYVKLRNERDALSTRVTALEKERERLIGVGARMSNLCFNMKQPGFTFEDHMREGCERLHRQWDEVRRKGEAG